MIYQSSRDRSDEERWEGKGVDDEPNHVLILQWENQDSYQFIDNSLFEMDAKVEVENPPLELHIVEKQNVRIDKLWSSYRNADFIRADHTPSIKWFPESELKELEEALLDEEHYHPCQNENYTWRMIASREQILIL